jgi:hypothetical protein
MRNGDEGVFLDIGTPVRFKVRSRRQTELLARVARWQTSRPLPNGRWSCRAVCGSSLRLHWRDPLAVQLWR